MKSGSEIVLPALLFGLIAGPPAMAQGGADKPVPATLLPRSTTLPPALLLPPADLPPAPIVARTGRAATAEAPAEVAAAAVEPLMTPPADPVPRPVSSSGAYVVQIAAVSSRERADSLAAAVGGYVMSAGKLFRVRTGPYASPAEARAALDRIHAKGYADARLMANDPRTAAALAALEPTP